MDKIEVVHKIKEIGVVAVIRGNNPEDAVATVSYTHLTLPTTERV